jgi:hypothetical protein
LSPKEEKLVEVYTVQGEAKAHIIKAKLESSGIPAMLISSAAPSVHVFVVDGLGAYGIMVPESLAGEARELLKGNADV